jgi:hypothetical protein
LATSNGGAVGPTVGGAVVAEKNHERFLPQLQPVEFGHQFPDELVHVEHIVRVVVFAVRRTVGRRQNVAVRMRQRVVGVKRSVAVLGDKLDEVPVHQVRHVFLVAQGAGLAVNDIGLHFLLGIPIGAAAGIAQIVVETKIRRLP